MSSSPGRLLAVGGSAGALAPLLQVSEGLRSEVDLGVIVCLHRPAGGRSVLTSVLSRHSALRAVEPRSGDPVHSGYIFIAPSGHHLEVRDGRFVVNPGPRVNGQRPSIDVLFRSVAREFDSRAAGMILSGNLDDGANGLRAIEVAGGAAVVQDPEEAEFADLPPTAIQRTDAPMVVAGERLLETALGALGIGEAAPRQQPSTSPPQEAFDPAQLGAADERGALVGVTCPECGGSLWLSGGAKDPVVACRIGHSMSPESLQTLHSERVDRALWAAVRTLEEQVAVSRFMQEMAQRRGDEGDASRYSGRADAAHEQAEELRELLLGQADAVGEPAD